MEGHPLHAVGFHPYARAKTVGPDSFISFLKQRRRWLLGAFANECHFIASWTMWKRAPILVLYKLVEFASRYVLECKDLRIMIRSGK